MHVRLAHVWEYHVAPDADAAFREHYGPEGTWVRLFRRSAGHLETLLLADEAAPGRYVTIDLWESTAHYARFRERFAAEYEALDRQCAALTTREVSLGVFAGVPDAAARTERDTSHGAGTPGDGPEGAA